MQPQLPIAQSHGYAVGHTLPPPNPSPASAPYGHQQPAVQSPYNDNELRNLPVPEPTPHQYVQAAHSGHSTPLRDQRPYPSEPSSYPRRGSASGATRSPDDYGYPAGRPLNIATTTEGPHYPAQHYPVDHGGAPPYHPHEGHINGTTNHGLPAPNYSDQGHPPLSAHPHDYSHSPVSANPHYGPSVMSAQSYQNMQRDKVRQKSHRAQQVSLADRANQQILDKIADLGKDIGKFMQGLQATNQRLDGVERAINNSQTKARMDSSPADAADVKSAPPYPTKKESPVLRSVDQSAHPFVKPAIPKVKDNDPPGISPNESSVATSTDSAMPNAVVSDDGRHVAISIEHATAAHRLLHWPSIHDIIHKSRMIRDISLGPDYVMSMEQNKGVLRLYGRGQGRESTSDAYGSPPGANLHGGSSPSSSASARSDDVSSPASSPPEGLWGWGSVPASNQEKQNYATAEGVSENLLDIHPRTMRRLLTSYLENIHILHPFLERSRLTRMFERFSLRYNKSEQTLSKTLFTGPISNLALDALKDSASGSQRTAKRKNSSGHYSTSGDPGYVPPQQGTDIRLEHNMSTAIVLLVMALGRVCECKKPLPGPVYVPGDHPESMAALRRLYSPSRLQPNSRSPPIMEQSPKPATYAGMNPSIPSLLSGSRAELASPRSAADDASGPRNVDVIPGLVYYAKATDILGNLFGLNDLTQVQAHLLAGLFQGQLARTFESWSWIHSACIACRFLVRESHLKQEKDSRQDLIKFAFWTCSQLESDILAELDLPRSGIQDINLDYPKGFMDDFEKADMPDSAIPYQTIMWYYSGQIHIRNMLNDIQSELYPPEGEHLPSPDDSTSLTHAPDKERAVRGTALRDHFHDRLKAWRELLPIGLQWSDSDPPSYDINTARLRAKYYGAQYIIHRPFLRHALDNSMDFPDTQSPHAHAVAAYQNRSSSFSPQAMERKPSNMGPPGPTQKEKIHQAEILQSARTCVAAAVQSTEAFDNIIKGQRLIVTNIFGTAHAQFGNMLVLATTYKSPLSFLIKRPKLEHLFDRTIKFLKSLEPISATLGQDALILEKLREVVFDDSNSQSFHSDES
ncbi:MAG: hypothetical protein LQ348_003988 [Seirophora lacunosa]|nr:MAG: hypothetical protein LQ344_005030 [Seirophora lacunosa]KAI4188031.1 MAG: hypothetical protein LQ348_003988 [Seirophora lacunosa]